MIGKHDEFESVANLREALKNRDSSEHTYLNYAKAIKTLLKVQTRYSDPDDVIKKVKSGEVKVVDLFRDFIACFAPKDWNGKWKIKKTSLRLLVAGLKKFLRANGVKVYAEDIKDLMPRIVKERKKEAPSKEQMREIMNYLSIRGKVILGLASGSGLRIGTILALQMRDIDLSQNLPVLKIPYAIVNEDEQVVRKMKGATSDDNRVHVTFMTPETKEWLESYIAYRKRKGEKITPESPVITFQVWQTPLGERKEKMGEFIPYWTAWRELRLALIKAGYVKEGRGKIHPHVFRAYFRTMLTQAGVSEPDIECLMAHQGGYLQTEYYLPKIDHLKKEYESAIQFLSIASGSIERSILEKQGKEIDTLKHELEEKAQEMEKLKKALGEQMSFQYTMLHLLTKLKPDEAHTVIKQYLERQQANLEELAHAG